jgi:thiamine-phosphate pyrophosphorylase
MLKNSSDILRVIDSNRNRAAEALRVLEDTARFVLDSQQLCTRAKEIRHRLAQILAPVASKLPAARRIENDVGTGVSTPSEKNRECITDVVNANASRLKESLRVLEEYGKIFDSGMGEALQNVRYEFYSFERKLLGALLPKSRLQEAILCAIVSSADPGGAVHIAQLAIDGGADMIQLREKDVPDGRFLEVALEVRRVTSAKDVLFIINDRADIASACGADGVHVGEGDLPVAEAGRLLGPDAIIGASAHSAEEAVAAQAGGADYLGVGSLFATSTKSDAVVRGVEVYLEVRQAVNIPCFGIGGINPDNIAGAVSTGLSRAAVASGIAGAPDPEDAARLIKKALLSNRKDENGNVTQGD